MSQMAISLMYFGFLTTFSVVLCSYFVYRALFNRRFKIYGFRCPNCDKTFRVTCKNCGQDSLKRRFGDMCCYSCNNRIYFVACPCGCNLDAARFIPLPHVFHPPTKKELIVSLINRKKSHPKINHQAVESKS